MSITYYRDRLPSIEQIIDVYRSAGLVRPLNDLARMAKMFQHSNLVLTAWDGDQIVGIARSVTDFCYCCYVSDLGVRQEYQRQGIGKQLLALTKEAIGEESMLLLRAAPDAMTYYPRLQMEVVNNGFIWKRTK